MESRNPSTVAVTTGILIGLEIGEWAGFTSGRLTVKEDDGGRIELRFGRESHGVIPEIGSLIKAEYTKGVFSEILNLELVSAPESTFYQDISETHGSSLFFAELNSLVMCALTEVIIGLLVVLMGLFWGLSNPMAFIIFGLCGIPHIIIGYMLWNYGGK